MHSPARHCNRFPIPPHIPGFAAYAFNSKLSTVNFLLTPLSVAFTHFDGGVGVAFHFFHPLPIYPSRGEGLNAHFLAFFVFSSLQTPLLRKAPRSISNFLPLNNLQTPRFATPLFCHPYKTGGVASVGLLGGRRGVPSSVLFGGRPGVAPPTLKRPTVRPRRRPASFFQRSPAYLRPFGAKPNLSLAVPKNATYNLPSTISGAHHGRRQKQQIAEIRQQTQWQPE
jgi:hypothetical protein